MKHQFQTFMMIVVCLFLTASTSTAQQVVNQAVSTAFVDALPFDPFGKFCGIGNSGGVLGPNGLGCDSYGFRAQDNFQAVNMGIETFSGVSFPTIQFTSTLPLIIQQQLTTGNGSGASSTCGKALAWYFDSNSIVSPPVNDIVYQVFGSALATNFWLTSDRKLKRNINSLTNALDIVRELNGVTYNFRSDEYPELNLTDKLQYGFLAQEVQTILPEAVQMATDMEGNDSHLTVNYTMVIPILTEAIKSQDDLLLEQTDLIQEQQQTIETLEERIVRLEQLILNNKSNTKNTSLSQNRPNPFSGVTTIQYDVPPTIDGAQLVVYDLRGAELQRLTIANGKGSINYDASNLASGVYVYTIEHRGESLARKKMVIK
ncbi:MAG: tail fiber domain-containing protein [Bacteroidota bacterium]